MNCHMWSVGLYIVDTGGVGVWCGVVWHWNRIGHGTVVLVDSMWCSVLFELR